MILLKRVLRSAVRRIAGARLRAVPRHRSRESRRSTPSAPASKRATSPVTNCGPIATARSLTSSCTPLANPRYTLNGAMPAMVLTLLARPLPANTRLAGRIVHVDPRIRRKAQAQARRPGAAASARRLAAPRGPASQSARRGAAPASRQQRAGVARARGGSRRGGAALARRPARRTDCRARRRTRLAGRLAPACRATGVAADALMPRPPPNDAAHSQRQSPRTPLIAATASLPNPAP